jgi:hypothetical protein
LFYFISFDLIWSDLIPHPWIYPIIKTDLHISAYICNPSQLRLMVYVASVVGAGRINTKTCFILSQSFFLVSWIGFFGGTHGFGFGESSWYI